MNSNQKEGPSSASGNNFHEAFQVCHDGTLGAGGYEFLPILQFKASRWLQRPCAGLRAS